MAKKELTRGSWGSLEVKLLRKFYGNNPTSDVAKDLGRPYEAVKRKASRLGLRKTRKYMKTLGR